MTSVLAWRTVHDMNRKSTAGTTRPNESAYSSRNTAPALVTRVTRSASHSRHAFMATGRELRANDRAAEFIAVETAVPSSAPAHVADGGGGAGRWISYHSG